MVMEKSWNVKNWPKVMELCLSVMEFYQFCPKMYQICMCFTATKKLSIDVKKKSHFQTLAQNAANAK